MRYENKDCLEFLKSLDDESVDLAILDPPYFEIIKDGAMWLDAGTPESLFQASQYVKIIQERQQILIGSPHYAAYRKKFITKQSLKKIINNFSNTFYQIGAIFTPLSPEHRVVNILY